MHELVAIDLPQDNSLAGVVTEIWEAGDALCILDPRLSSEGRARALATLQPTILLDRSGPHELKSGTSVQEGDALVIMSSGSTADPKAVIHTMASLWASAEMTSDRLGVDPLRDKWLCCLPAVHIGGFSVIARALLTSTPLEILANAEPVALGEAAERGASHVSLVATTLRRIDPSLFSCIVLGGAAPPVELPSNVVTTYGLTETGSGVVYDGIALDGVEIAIDQEDPDGFGEILVNTPTLFRSYRDRPVPWVRGSDGRAVWFPTGDLGRLSKQGTLEVRGRIADVIVTGGEKVFPGDVEAAILGLENVSEVAVWKRPDAEWGERVVAWIVPKDAAPTLDEVRGIVKDKVTAYAAPKEIELVSQLPRSALGKLQRHALS